MLRSIFRREQGQGFVEYALVAVLIAIIVVGILWLTGDKVSTVFPPPTASVRP